LTYTVSHSITPDVAVLTTHPQPNPPAEFGDLVFGDGTRTVTLRDCKVSRMTGRTDGSGTSWTLEVLDRRWRWDGLGSIFGEYNRLDNQGKLVPWTIRSPTELATLCLQAMGEENFAINLPPGLPSTVGESIDKYLALGDSFPQTQTNPPTVWTGLPPAQMLAQLADIYGCRVIFQPSANRVVVAPLGVGAPLPDGPCEAITPALKAPVIPAAVAAIGAPVRIQMRLGLEAVGEEWSGQYVPIDELSYRPRSPGQVQISQGTFTGSGVPTLEVTVAINYGKPTEYQKLFTGTGSTVASKLASIADLVNADPTLSPVIFAAATSTQITLAGQVQGQEFFCSFTSPDVVPPDTFIGSVSQIAAAPGKNSWALSYPLEFPTVVATAALEYAEAKAKAQKSVFRCYRIKDVDVGTNARPIRVPWYGNIIRRQQLILQPTKAQQITPGVRVADLANPNNPTVTPGSGIPPAFYNGYSRDMPAEVRGRVASNMGPAGNGSVSVAIPAGLGEGTPNTADDQLVLVPFEIDPVEQLVVFAEPVWKWVTVGGPTALQYAPADLTLEAAVLVQDTDNNAIVRYIQSLALGGPAPAEHSRHEDMQPSVIGQYLGTDGIVQRNTLIGFQWQDKQDADSRAAYYLNNQALKYQITGGETRQYIGTFPIDPDGAIQQVQWSFGTAGATTIASRNTEHDYRIPDYAVRRQAENLRGDVVAFLIELAERNSMFGHTRPKPGG
jgi:hypothetical protein